MSKRLKGTLVGIAFSLAAIVLWVILAFLGFIAGIAGALMGILFIIGYKKFSEEQKVSGYVITAASILIVVEVFIAELITVFILANDVGVSFSDAMSVSEVQSAVVQDVLIGLALSFIVFIGYIVSLKRKAKIEAAHADAVAKQKAVSDETVQTANDNIDNNQTETATSNVNTINSTETMDDSL